MGEIGHRLKIDDLQHRVGGAFDEHELCRRGQGLLPLAEIGAVDEDGLYAVARQQGGDDPVAGTEEGACGHDPVTRLEMGEHRRCNGRHAGSGGAARLRTLQQSQSLLKHLDRWVAEARILEVLDLAEKGLLGLFRAVIDEAGAEKERLAGLAVIAAHGAAMDEKAGGTEGFRGLGHGRGPLLEKPGLRCSEGTRAHLHWPL